MQDVDSWGRESAKRESLLGSPPSTNFKRQRTRCGHSGLQGQTPVSIATPPDWSNSVLGWLGRDTEERHPNLGGCSWAHVGLGDREGGLPINISQLGCRGQRSRVQRPGSDPPRRGPGPGLGTALATSHPPSLAVTPKGKHPQGLMQILGDFLSSPRAKPAECSLIRTG